MSRTIRLSEGETEILIRALKESESQHKAKTGETQMMQRQAEAAPAAPTANAATPQTSNFIL